ncbi:MAG: nucleoside-diphosphate sugar epimerase/dehydratase [Acetivibrio ethanolgignens]
MIEVTHQDIFEIYQNFFIEKRRLLERKKIAIFGAGVRGMMLVMLLKKRGVSSVLFIDNDREKQGKEIEGIRIYPLEYLEDKTEEIIVLLSMERNQEAEAELISFGYKKNETFFILLEERYQKSYHDFQKKNSRLLLGDCIVDSILINEKEKVSLRLLLKERYAEEISIIAEHGFYMRQYYYIMKNYINRNTLIKKIVILVSPEIFHSKYHLYPNAQHIKFMRCILHEKEYEQKEFLKELEERDRGEWKLSFLPNRLAGREHQENAKRVFTKLNYMYRVDIENESFFYLKKAVELCKKRKIEFHVCVAPINYSLAESLWGEEFRKSYSFILQSIADTVGEEGFLNYSNLIEEHHFVSICSINEAMDFAGREKLAKNLEYYL